jgi:hypothetical protein
MTAAARLCIDTTLEALRQTVGRDEHVPFLKHLVEGQIGLVTFAEIADGLASIDVSGRDPEWRDVGRANRDAQAPACGPHGLVPSRTWRRRLAASQGRVSNSIHSSSAARPVSARIFHAGCLNDGGLRLLSGKNHLHRGGARDRPSCHRAYASSNGSADRTSEERARDTSYDGTRRSSPVIRLSEV